MLSWRQASHMAWSVEFDGLALVDTSKGTVLRLGYPRAALWDLMGRDRSLPGIVSKMSAIAALDMEHAERLVRETVREWVEAGLLVAEGERG